MTDPFFIMARKVAPALLTGNTVVIKPSGEIPATALARLLSQLEPPL